MTSALGLSMTEQASWVVGVATYQEVLEDLKVFLLSDPQLLRILHASSHAFGVWTVSKLRDVLALLLGVWEVAEAVR